MSGGAIDYHGEYNEYSVQANAKYALEQSKHEHHGELVFFDNKLLNDNRKNLELLDALRKSIINHCDGYYLCFQPIISTENGLWELKHCCAGISRLSAKYRRGFSFHVWKMTQASMTLGTGF